MAQNPKISGIVYNEENNEPIPYVNIRIAGTTQGTSTNPDGKFILNMPLEKNRLIFTVVGFRKKEIEINYQSNKEVKVGMKAESIQFLEIIVGVDEDPAYRLIREAIKRKNKNREGLKSLEYDFFAKDIFLASGKVAMISEKFSTGYYQTGKNEKVITHSLHISENEKKNALQFNQNILSKMFIDFTDDTLDIISNKVFLPLARNAFDFYEYHLIEVKQSGSFHDCFIEVIPRSNIQPLLKGTIVIEDSSFSLKSIKLSNNEGLRFPFINNLNIELVQKRDRFMDYWLPTYLKVISSLKLNFSGLLETDNVSMNQEAMFTNYKVNQAIPDSIYNTYSTLKIDTNNVKKRECKNKYVKTEVLSRTQIDSLRPIPLTNEEINAYKELDSSKTIGTQIKFTGILGGIASDAAKMEAGKSSNAGFLEYILKIFSVLYLRDNKVNGIVFGAHHSKSFFDNIFNAKVSIGYALGRKNIEWKISLDANTNYGLLSQINMELHDEALQCRCFILIQIY